MNDQVKPSAKHCAQMWPKVRVLSQALRACAHMPRKASLGMARTTELNALSRSSLQQRRTHNA